ncbi:uncharacterized protein LOC111039168 [Myzus persicae]|uniref:uncharacterized protein LOC111039168 n=1 Tax=Myzus persicae TaxID=13164 RepID=UPI000B932273|nr:uncharacterized protein LOC111039168 [Myzus persicae]XP_022178202.1 uncharacterized protein LOC111039168 [Myzus persicae]XP_022178203.1 uncharacterized protein LOC111039168 [Myzus persicae]XP_022178204.1 uncharacterized protein LOC111039168 [Myzus persicae]XP_022178205.1 uncharacterized protein LOC111039168 [Myzus persicae]
MFIRKPSGNLKRKGFSQDPYLIIATVFYTASLTVSTSFQDNLLTRKSCEPLIPFGECLVGVYESQHLVYSSTSVLQYLISFTVALIAGAWSDSQGRRRKPLIILPIIAQVLTDGLNFGISHWNWFNYHYIILQWISPALYVGRNIFWVGLMSYVSENSTVKSRTLQHGIIIATYPISSLMGAGLVALLKIVVRYRAYDFLFFVPILLNLIALLVVDLRVKDTSDSCNREIVWQRPKYVLKEFTDIFKDKLKSSAVVLAILIICQSILVTRIGCDYDLVMNYVTSSRMYHNDEEVYFAVLKMMALFFGTVFSVSVLSHCMKINDLLISISVCCFYIAAAVCYIFADLFFQIFLITIIYLCHGTAITIVSSLTSKLVPIEQLGRLNAIQMCMNSLLTLVVVTAYQFVFNPMYSSRCDNLCLFCILYAVLTLPILYVFSILYSKYKHVWQNDTTEDKQYIYVIS